MQKNSKAKEILSVTVVVLISVIIIRAFFVESFIVKGDSMSPSILSGDYVFVSKRAYKGDREPSRGDVVVATSRDEGIRIVKRVIGLPGERVEIGEGKISIKESRVDEGVILDEQYLSFGDTPLGTLNVIKLDPKEYFILGDNRYVSIDSRELGPVDHWSLKGKVVLSLSFKNLTIKRF